jgi:hypothetical protein
MIFVIGINYSRHFTKSTSNIYVTSNRWFAIYHTSDQHHLQHTLSRRRRINIEHHEHQHIEHIAFCCQWRCRRCAAGAGAGAAAAVVLLLLLSPRCCYCSGDAAMILARC